MNSRIRITLIFAALAGLVVAGGVFFLIARSGTTVAAGDLYSTSVTAPVNDAALDLFPPAEEAPEPPLSADGVGLFDPDTATWHLRTRAGDPTVFVFGEPGTTPLVGDWNGDGVDTVGTYDPASGAVGLRNENTPGPPGVTYVLDGKDGTAVAGDFDGDGIDTIAVVAQDGSTVAVFDADGVQVGSYAVGVGEQAPFVGDFDGDGTDTIATRDPATGVVTIYGPDGAPASSFMFETAGARAFAGDWNADGVDTPGVFAAEPATVELRYADTDGGPDESYPWGRSSWIPVSGDFGELASNVTVNVDGAPDGLAWAVESLYLELDAAPSYEGARADETQPPDPDQAITVTGLATTADAFGAQVAVVKSDTDLILAVSHDGWTWGIVGGALASRDFSATDPSPRFVLLIGSDWQADAEGNYPESPLVSYADSLHIYAVNLAEKTGAIVGIPRDTAMTYDGPGNVDGKQKINRTMKGNGPAVTTEVLAHETHLPIEGYVQTGFGSRITGFPGFEDVVDAVGGVDFLVPYSVPSQCRADPSPPLAAEGDTHVDGIGALAFSRERKCIPTDANGAPIRNGNVIRTLGQGLLMKAAVVQVHDLGIMAMPGLLDVMDDFTTTDLSPAELLTLAATVYEIDPGPMPTLTGADVDALGYDAYDLNAGNLPNVVVEGCTAIFDPAAGDYAQWFVDGNYATFDDVADGTLDQLPVYRYDSGNPEYPLACPWVLP